MTYQNWQEKITKLNANERGSVIFTNDHKIKEFMFTTLRELYPDAYRQDTRGVCSIWVPKQTNSVDRKSRLLSIVTQLPGDTLSTLAPLKATGAASNLSNPKFRPYLLTSTTLDEWLLVASNPVSFQISQDLNESQVVIPPRSACFNPYLATGSSTTTVLACRDQTMISLNREGVILATWASPEQPSALTCDEEFLYVAFFDHHLIEIQSFEGRHIRDFGVPGWQPGQLFFPTALALTDDGRLAVADLLQRVQFFDLQTGAYLGGFPCRASEGLPRSKIEIVSGDLVLATNQEAAEVELYYQGRSWGITAKRRDPRSLDSQKIRDYSVVNEAIMAILTQDQDGLILIQRYDLRPLLDSFAALKPIIDR